MARLRACVLGKILRAHANVATKCARAELDESNLVAVRPFSARTRCFLLLRAEI